MADMHVAERIESLQRSRDKEVHASQEQHIDVVPVYSDSDLFQFEEYFYPNERIQLKTRDYEPLGHFDHPHADVFVDATDLNKYLNQMPNDEDSSHDEDRPPGSEEVFLSTPDIYDGCMNSTKYSPELTNAQRRLLRDVAPYTFNVHDSPEIQWSKLQKRRQLITGYCKDLKRKRYARRYRRWLDVRSRGLDLKDETLALISGEVHDKSLNREFYYVAYEPYEFSHVLLQDRMQAVKKKMRQYLCYPNWRRSYRNHVYYSVNADVPDNDTRHMDGHVVLVDHEGVVAEDLLGASGLSGFGDESDVTDANVSILNISECGDSCGDLEEEIDYVDGEYESYEDSVADNAEHVEYSEDPDYSKHTQYNDEAEYIEDEDIDEFFDYANGDLSGDDMSKNNDNLEDYDYDEQEYGLADKTFDNDNDWRSNWLKRVPQLPALPQWAQRPSPLQSQWAPHKDTEAYNNQHVDDELGYEVDSTFFDDNIPSSEECEMSSECDSNPSTPGFERPISTEKREMFLKIAETDVNAEFKNRTIMDYNMFLIQKRRHDAIRRLKSVQRLCLPIEEEANLLCERELEDKRLNHSYYYEPGEPRAYARILFNRRRAIKRKFRNFATDTEFAVAYRRRVMSDIDRNITLDD